MEGMLLERRTVSQAAAILCLLCAIVAVPSTAQTTQDKKDNRLKVKVLVENPFIIESKVDPTGFEGMFIDILENVTVTAGFAFDILHEPHTIYGYEHSEGNWTGLIGSLLNKEADLIVAPLTITSKRHDVVDFSLPIMSSGLRILFKPANPWEDWDSFLLLLQPFTGAVWAVLLLLFLGVSVLFYLVGRFSPYEDHAFVGRAATYQGLTLTNSFLYAFSALTFQGYTAAPRSLSGRVLAAVWWVFVLMVMAAYTASLTAVLLAFKPSVTSLPFSTFTQLTRQHHVAYGMVGGGSTEFYLRRSKQPLQRRLYGTMNAHREDVMVSSITEGLHKVRAHPGEFALVMEGPMAEYLSEQAPCDLVTVGEELNSHNYGFACQKGSGVCSKLSAAILQMREQDFIFDLRKKWLHQGCRREQVGDYIYRGLSYVDTWGSSPQYYAQRSLTLRRLGAGLLWLGLGLAVSTALLGAEVLHARRSGRGGTQVPQRLPVGRDDMERIDREFRDDAVN